METNREIVILIINKSNSDESNFSIFAAIAGIGNKSNSYDIGIVPVFIVRPVEGI